MFAAFQYRRLVVIVVLALAGFFGLFCRFFEIQVCRHRELAAKAERFNGTIRVLEAWRGQIKDRNGKVLAISVPVKTIYANTVLCSNRLEQVARTCGPLLQIPPGALAARLRAGLQSTGSQKALLIKRNVPVAEWSRIASALELETFGMDRFNLTAGERRELQKLRRKTFFARDAQVRLNPYGESLSSLVGFASPQTNGAGLKGISGIEQALNGILEGEEGLCVSKQDAAGEELPSQRVQFKLPANGANVVLTIDAQLQQIVARALADAQTRCQARAASAIIMNPRTFEVLALVCLPGFDPRNPGAATPATWRNSALSDMVEPGSTFKTITLAAALDQGLMTLDSGIYCEGGQLILNQATVKDHAAYGLLTLRQAFARSSNVAFAKIALKLGPQRLHHYMTSFGFGQRTGIPWVGETPGRIDPPQTWSTMTLTRAAFGQGMSVSQIQMAVAMCVIANDGRLMRPLLVNRVESPQGKVFHRFEPQFIRRVVSPQTARQVREALAAVIEPGGTGALAAMDHYTVAAKTGTAQKSNRYGYEKGRYYSSMIGFLPADAPQVLISVALDEPQNRYYAGTVVAPVFRSIAEQTAACLCVSPDKAPNNRPGNQIAQARTAAAQPLRAVSGQALGAASVARTELVSALRP